MRSRKLVFMIAASAAVAFAPLTVQADQLWERSDAAFGQSISEDDLALWDIDIDTPTGGNLPPGEGTVSAGAEVYELQCVHCHGEKAEGGPMYGSMVGGIGTMDQSPRVLTPGSMYPYAPILFDYTRRAMPLDNPHSMSDDEVYAVSAYLYHLNGLVDDDFTANAETLAAIEMPNQGNFIEDDRPDVEAERCMSDCKPIGTVADADDEGGALDEPKAGGTGGQIQMGTEDDEDSE